jgi:aminopeptidase N
MIQKIVPALLIAFLFSCGSEDTKNENVKEDSKDKTTTDSVGVNNHSYSNIDEINTSHLHLDLEVNFDDKVISGVARHTMNNTGTTKAIFDFNDLTIERVTLGDEENESETTFSVGKDDDKLLGKPLVVDINKDTKYVNIYYATTAESEALDWLAPELTGSGKHPFLYTQGQAILTRSWVPVQDTPENRITYSADLKVPSELLALMSATNPTEKNETGEYSFEMKQPIPSYLLALAVGELEYADLGNNCGVYAEPHMIDKAAYEFEDIPKMMTAAEDLYGDYLWETYDVIVLPYSFPFGGMENPRLTFATPTLIAGDQSLVSVIAHELAHSWSGNLVTNATWNDFWLNEGFTVYFENRIMEELYGKEVADMLALIEYQELEGSVAEMISDGHSEDTHLKLALNHRNPDEGMTDIAYVKGSFFLKTLESKVGREKFDEFLSSYFQEYKFKTITTEDFVNYLNKNLLEKENIEFNTDEWIYGEGIPDNSVEIVSERFTYVQDLAKEIKTGDQELPSDMQRGDYTTQEWLAFIRAFEGEVNVETMKTIDEQLNFKSSGNAEIMAEWFVLGIQNNYDVIRPEIKKFLVKVGRRKFLRPIYSTLANADEDDLEFAKEVYKEARPNYHAVSFNTIDDILGVNE